MLKNNIMPEYELDSQKQIHENEDAVPVNKKAMPFAWISLGSSVVLLAWTAWWSISFINAFIINKCEGTSCGEAFAWTLITGLFFSIQFGALSLSFGLLSKDHKTNNEKRKRTILLVSLLCSLPSIILAVIPIIYTSIVSR